MRKKGNHLRWLLCVLFILGMVHTAAVGRVIYVDDDTVGVNDGSSWIDAFSDLQDAIAAARAGDEIRVAEGVYTPDKGSGIALGDRKATFQLINGVALMGGYAGLSTLDSDVRDVEIYETILSGDLEDNDADVDVNNPYDYFYEPTRRDNSVNVVTSTADDASAVLDGFIVTGAVNGGLLIVAGSPTILNCVFNRNSASEGSGISIWQGQSLLKNCKFISNIGGGALFGMDINLTLSECSFTGNYSGGAFISGSAVLTGCVFSDNTSSDGGGIEHSSRELDIGKLELINCIFVDNSAVPSPYNWYGCGGAVKTTNATVRNCMFSGNWARCGGAIYGEVQSVENCMFTANTAEQGGCLTIGSSIITNCVFSGNRAEEGGVLFAAGSGSGPSLMFCTLSDNSAQNGNAISLSPGGRAPALLSMNISNCILWNGGNEINAWREDFADISIVYSNIQGGWSGEGNIDLDPFFADPGHWDPNGTADDPNDDFWIEGDYHLKSQAGRWNPVSESWIIDDITSPCIDAGDPNSPVAFEPFPNGGIINIGAYGGTVEASLSPSGMHTKYGGGSGTAEDPYLIYTAEQMNTIGIEPNDWDKYFKLMADIDLKDFGDSSFNLIGSNSQPFLGVFDGNGHSISNLTYAVTGNEELTDDAIIANFGLFRSINDPNAMIRDLRLVNPDVGPASACVKRIWHMGALVGSLGSGTVSNCQVEGGQVKGESRTGGLVGFSRGTISNCYTTCRVQQAEQRSLTEANESLDRREFFGGLVGVNIGEISNCHTAGEISGERKIGGLVGEDDGRISNSWSDSNVSGDLDVGGLVGKNRSTSVLSNCYARGYISGIKSVGGLIGYCMGSIIDCHATGNVSAEQWGGGLTGLNEGTVTSCYSIASVSVNSDIAGGLVGFNGGTILTSLARGDVTGEQSIGGLVGENRKWYQVVAGIPIEYDGVVLDCYARGSVHGMYGVGGLIGTNTGTILKCYSIGEVKGEMNFGGLVGINGEIQVMGSFWDTETSSLDTSSGGSGKTNTEMQAVSTFLDAGWDFVDETENGMEDIWWILEGQDYPRMWWERTEIGE